jgi:hypothetical protein
MAEERIAQRIDANLLDISINSLQSLTKKQYETAFTQLKQRHIFGRLMIKEYPTGGAHAGHFRALIDELALKKSFVPDLLIIDYINICSSSRFKAGGQVNSYSYVKSISEELRGLAVECKVPCLSATQFNRSGMDNSDPGITNTSDSMGMAFSADLQLAVISSEELDVDSLLLIKQLKNRYDDTSQHRKFTVKVDRSKMRISNDSSQSFVSATTPAVINQVNIAKPKLKKFDTGANGTAPQITF